MTPYLPVDLNAQFLVTRKGQAEWLRPTQMTLVELEHTYERALRHEKSGIHNPNNALLSEELERRALNLTGGEGVTC